MSRLPYITLFVLLLAPIGARAGNVSSQSASTSAPTRVFLHGHNPALSDGRHNFRVRVLSSDGGMVFSEDFESDVRSGSYDLMLGSSQPLFVSIAKNMTIEVAVDGGTESQALDPAPLVSSLEPRLIDALRAREEHGFDAIVRQQLAAQSEERVIRHRAGLASRLRSALAMLDQYEPYSGLELEMSVAPPAENVPHDPYQLAKYGRISVEYKNLTSVDGNRLGLAAQALHVAHHILLYSAGISTDINNDGMFTMTTGYTHYQVGNKRWEPFVDAPFMRFRFRSSPQNVFAYSELETTMHERAYLSAMLGLGMMVAPGLRFIAGFQHTEFTMPTEGYVQQVNGLQGTFMWGAR